MNEFGVSAEMLAKKDAPEDAAAAVEGEEAPLPLQETAPEASEESEAEKVAAQNPKQKSKKAKKVD